MLEDAGYLNVLRSLRFYVDVILNKFRFASKRINYVVPSSGWSVDWDVEYITRSVNNLLGTSSRGETANYFYVNELPKVDNFFLIFVRKKMTAFPKGWLGFERIN